jgi:hypothetical protein
MVTFALYAGILYVTLSLTLKFHLFLVNMTNNVEKIGMNNFELLRVLGTGGKLLTFFNCLRIGKGRLSDLFISPVLS